MDWVAISTWVDIAWKIGTVAALIWLGVRQQGTDNHRRIVALDDRVDGHAVRIVRVEETLKRGPSHDDLQLIHDRISKGNDLTHAVQAQVSGLTGSMDIALRKLELLDRTHYREGGQ
ncbi:hypothetical protein [Roseospira goensis]|uniref:DUF2730 family protein n=1 Tax=Roseospira goensis TaxID=391922 RepID=A0A7W6S2P7_9PROT|nr:hypothetical protein [Roseospira goensis]MBB4287734.1 hypothetical protein [Roseospira goensis]